MSQVIEADQLERTLRSMESRLANGSSAAMQQCAEIAKAAFERNFDTASTASGQKWAKHAPYTVKRYGPHPLLILTGKMKSATIADGDGHVERVTGDSMEVGLSVDAIPYAPAHQYGTDRIPQREFIACNSDDIDEMADVITAALAAELERV